MSETTLTTGETAEILALLAEIYPDAHCELNFRTPFELLVATMLSAQTTDRKVNAVTANLFERCQSPEGCLNLGLTALEEQIKSLGLFHNKAKHILATCRRLQEDYDSKVPQDIATLMTLPGIGQKTANVIVSNAFGIPAIAVDTHVFRVANRVGLAHSTKVLQVEQSLRKLVPRNQWSKAHHLLIWHGRRLCTARKPRCSDCPLKPYCRHYRTLTASA